MARLTEMYKAEVAPALMKKFEYKSSMQIPKLDKVVINVGAGEAKENSKVIDAIINDPVMANTVIKEKNLNCKVTGEPVFTEAIGIILQKNEKGEELKEKFDAIIEEMKKDGTLSKLSTEITGGDYIPE